MTATVPGPSRRRRVLAWCVVGLLMLVGGGFLAQQQIRIATPKGTLLSDADDPNAEIVVKKNGAVLPANASKPVPSAPAKQADPAELECRLKAGDSWVDALVITPDGKSVIASYGEGCLRV